MTTRTLQTIVIVSVCYVAAQIFADVASLRILLVGGFSIDGGTFIYPFTFTLRDMVHKLAGAKIARTLIFVAAPLNLLMAGLFYLVASLPPDLLVGEQAEFAAVFAAEGLLRIVIASITAEVVSELLDTEIYKAWVARFQQRYQWGRVLASNAVSVPVDSAIFVAIAFSGLVPASVAFGILLTNVLVKGLVTLVSIPGIYLVKEQPTPLTDG